MEVTIEMAASINGLIATKEGSEDFLSERNYQIMLDFLKEYDCLVWGNKTFQNVISWGEDYINDLNDITVIIFSKTQNSSNYKNVIYVNALEEFKKVCKEKNLNKIFVSGGAHTNTLFLENNLANRIIINYNPYLLTKGINLFEGKYLEKELQLEKVVKEEEGIVQIWYQVKEK